MLEKADEGMRELEGLMMYGVGTFPIPPRFLPSCPGKVTCCQIGIRRLLMEQQVDDALEVVAMQIRLYAKLGKGDIGKSAFISTGQRTLLRYRFQMF